MRLEHYQQFMFSFGNEFPTFLNLLTACTKVLQRPCALSSSSECHMAFCFLHLPTLEANQALTWC